MTITIKGDISEEITVEQFEYIIDMMCLFGIKNTTINIDGDPSKEDDNAENNQTES